MKCVIRVDSSSKIGSGHLMRCLTLSNELKKYSVEITFISRAHEGNLSEIIIRNDFSLIQLPAPNLSPTYKIRESGENCTEWLGVTQEEDAQETINAIKKLKPDLLIVDHYGLGEVWEKKLRFYVKNIMVIDDLANRSHDCDILLDQNWFENKESRYQELVPAPCTTLLGPEYALLRPEFTKARKNLKNRVDQIKRVFVFFGASDPSNLTGLTLEVLSEPEFANLEVDVVIGLHNECRTHIEHQINLRPLTQLHVQIDNMAEIMAKAGLAISAGGASTWERFCVGLPSLVVTIAENQLPFSRDLHQNGLLRWLGTSENVDLQVLRQELMQALQDTDRNHQEAEMGMLLVDGMGTLHVSEMLLRGPVPECLFVRKTVEGDCRLFWYWANDPEVRKNAFYPDEIPWDEHKKWFFEKLEDPYTTLYVIHSKEGPVGQVRFDRKGAEYVISYSLARQFRGFSLGGKILQLAINKLKKTLCGTLRAEVKADNIPSNRIFRNLGFTEIESLQNGKLVFQKQI